MPDPVILSANATIVVKSRTAVTKNAAAVLTDAEVLGGLVLLTAAAALTLPAAGTGNAGADLYVSATAAERWSAQQASTAAGAASPP